MQTVMETSCVGDLRFSFAFAFFPGAGAGAGAIKALAGAFLSFPAFASTCPAFGSAGRATLGLCPRGLGSTTLLSSLF